MTTTEPTPTLLELLEEAAKTSDFEAAKRRAKTGQNDAGRVLDAAMAMVHETRAARLRAAATRLREELTTRKAELAESVAKGYLRVDHGEGEAQARAIEALEIINGGPANTGSGE